MWQDILKTALVGTERTALTLPPRNDAVGELLAKLDVNARESALLSAAATIALYERAGQLPVTNQQPLPAPAETDDAPCCSDRAAHHLSLLLSNDDYREMQREWFTTLAQAGKRVPESWLVVLLKLGKTDSFLRESIVQVIGKRGAWVAQQNPDWNYVLGELDEAVWETGAAPMRLALLKKLRATDPTHARELVALTWAQETPEERAAFVAAFADSLSLADEAFLEAALDDRRKEVRQAAAALLARLPVSAYVQRMIARVKPLLTFRRKFIGKDKIEIALPTECDKAMKRDGIEPKPSYANVGEKAWWLQQMLSLVPPDIWVSASGWTIDELLNAARRSEWRKMLLESWLNANQLARSVAWAEALHAAKLGEDGALAMLHILPRTRQEEIILNLLKKDPSLLAAGRNKRYLIAYQHQWSAELTLLFTESICFHAQRDGFQTEFWWERYLINTSIHFDFATIPQVITRLSQLNHSLPASLPVLDALLAALDLRYTAIREITQ
ncbi:MAG: DUF5691 domain-containing protein [Blastocatellia bacterium]